jgi:hypothetical protein
MTTPRLPSNPFTISDLRPQANTWTAESVRTKFAEREMDRYAIDEIQRDLEELQRWDDYERQTAENREAAKKALRDLLAGRR